MDELEELNEVIDNLLSIDPNKLDEEALRTPQIHGELNNLYNRYSYEFNRLDEKYSILKLQRWKYYAGQQTPEYYKKYGKPKHMITKSEINMYLDSDAMMHKAKATMDVINAKLKTVESAMKQLQQRAFLIKDAIAWKQFLAGG